MKIADIKFSEADIALLENREQQLYNQMRDEYNSDKPNIKALHQTRKSFVNVSNWIIEAKFKTPFKRHDNRN